MISVFCQLFCTGSLIYFVYVYGRLLQCTGRNITNFFLVREVPVVAALFTDWSIHISNNSIW